MAKNTEWIQLQEDLRPHLPKLSQAADTVVNEEVSNYPVFLTYAATEDKALQLGIPVFVAPTARGREWTVHVTTLEELATKGIVLREKVDDFIKIYKSNVGQLCFLIYTEGEARFGFLAR
ncbi:hypothetical protein CEQ90_08230 [Lewinellaceae bacterium SD302]|nr:hypothetical protein CEQ90_08230 [Lewinellaceae bacterium SD302]